MIDINQADLVKLLTVIRSKRLKPINGSLNAFCDGTPEAVGLRDRHAADLADIEKVVPIYVWEQLKVLEDEKRSAEGAEVGGRDSKDGLEPVLRRVAENRDRAPYFSEWRHLKSGQLYVVNMHVIQEATLEPAVVYYGKFADPREIWCRTAFEFFDGRFVREQGEVREPGLGGNPF
ncbi:hypothetical protein [Roseibium sp. RKSG952]|uniref:hypothetical protein n=1 Tax=Roseibium sp. RKSG952 TaxID=2529384 RepID=UPI0012BBDD58|nr:hypothetical protein [Roseibium sp. RKSG952]MTH95487.1 hypothetical protein [Roseibium sp. RKSG952]